MKKNKSNREVSRFGQMLGDCEPMRDVYTLIAKVAPTDASVLINGGSGTGKELVADAIHRRSGRRDAPFVAVNCGAIAESLVESELFGHEKGAFTGAQKKHLGVFEQANGGTLFLDEITEMPLEMQVRLLRTLETGTVRRLGSEVDIPVNVRVIAATNREPLAAVHQGFLRIDLLFRLAVFEISMPSLRERGNDILFLARYFLSQHNQANGLAKKLSVTAESRLKAYDWPGNVRQLRNVIHRAFIMEGTTIDLDCLRNLLEDEEPAGIVSVDVADRDGRAMCGGGGVSNDARDQMTSVKFGDSVSMPVTVANSEEQATVTFTVGSTIDEVEKLLILRTMKELNGAKPQVAMLLGVSLKTLYNRLNSYAEHTQTP